MHNARVCLGLLGSRVGMWGKVGSVQILYVNTITVGYYYM